MSPSGIKATSRYDMWTGVSLNACNEPYSNITPLATPIVESETRLGLSLALGLIARIMSIRLAETAG